MNMKRVFAFLVLFFFTIVLTTTRPSSALTSPDRPTAFGEGEFTFRNMLHDRIESWAFSFDATVNKNGKGKVAASLRKSLVDIQRGRVKDRYGWVRRVI